MKKKYPIAIIICLAVMSSAGCRRYEHRKEEKVIKKERSEVEKSTSDLSEAIIITDQAGWDSVGDYRHFKDTSMMRIQVCNTGILNFKKAMKKDSNVIPALYKGRISKLEKRSRELEQRLKHYTIKDRANWDDFTRLFNFDLEQLEQSVKRLNKK